MKLIKPFFLAMALLLVGIGSSAQPGYMGKRFSVAYHYEATPYFGFFKRLIVEMEDEPLIRLVTGHGADLGFVLNRKTEFIGSFNFRKMSYAYQRFINTNGDVYSTNTPSFLANEMSINVGFRHYFKEHIAPVGPYHQITFGTSSTKYADKKNVIPLLHSSDYYNIINPNEADVYKKSISIKRFSYGLGTKRIISNSIYCFAEANVNFTVSSSSKYYQLKLDNTPVVDEEDYSEACITQNFSRNKRYSFFFGVGILL